MDITPALVHYYVGSRDHLTSGIMNLFYKGTVKNWPAQTGDWQHDVVNAAEHMYMHLLESPGIEAHLVQKNEYRSENESRLGKECVSKCNSRRYQDHAKKKTKKI